MATAETWKVQGNEALRQGQLDEAIRCFTEGLALDQGHAVLFSNRSAVYGQMGSWTEALADADKAIECRPGWGKAFTRRGVALYHQGRYEDAIRAYNDALKLEPGNEEHPKTISMIQSAWKASEQNCLGEEQLTRGKVALALPFFEEASKLDPQCALYWSNLSHAHRLLRQLDLASKEADQVISLRPKWHKGYQRKAEVLYDDHQFEKSAATFAYALQIEPNNDQLNQGFTKAQGELFRTQKRETPSSPTSPASPKGPLDSIKNFFGF